MSAKKFLPLIGITLFLFILSRINLQQFISVVFSAKPFFLLLSFCVVLPVLFFQNLKWYLLVEANQIRVPFKKTVWPFLYSWFYGIVTPGRIGTFMKIFYLKEITVLPLGRCTPSVVFERLIDLTVVVLFAVIGAFFLSEYIQGLFMVFVFLLALVLAGFFVFFRPRLLRRMLKLFSGFVLPERFKEKAKSSFESFYEGFPPKKRLVLPFFIAVLSWMTIYFQAYLIAVSLSIDISYWVLLMILPVSTLITLIPVTVSGLGTREAALIFLLSFFGLSAETTVVFSLLSLVVSTLLPILLFGVFFLFFKIGSRKNERGPP